MNLGYVLSPIAHFEANSQIAEMYDSHFDGGEWSGPAHARYYPIGLRRAQRIARARAGVSRSFFKRLLRRSDVNAAIDVCAWKIFCREVGITPKGRKVK